MQFYSTKHISPNANLQTVVIKGLPADNGLFMPEVITPLSNNFWQNLPNYTFQEMAFEVTKTLLQNSINDQDLQNIIESSITFDAPLININNNINCLELFHGPSLAFKDFGAQFMAKLMGYFTQQQTNNKPLTILVATSGDTGGAVAQGFLKVKGTQVVILYPSGKISELQEKQLTTIGNNIYALEVKGVFDDCQHLVKTAFLDTQLNNQCNLSSANSINLARLIPQMFYYFWAYKQLKNKNKKIVFSVPSGNFGNLTAGLIAKKMGLPVHKFVAATNANRVFTDYLQNNIFIAKPSIPTLSNAMDVGNPSNLQRINDLYKNNLQNIKNDIEAFSFTDDQTISAMQSVYRLHNYVMCPHTAVAYLGLQQYLQQNANNNLQGIFLSTAHPAKFIEVVNNALNTVIPLPKTLSDLQSKNKQSTIIDVDYGQLKQYVLELNT